MSSSTSSTATTKPMDLLKQQAYICGALCGHTVKLCNLLILAVVLVLEWVLNSPRQVKRNRQLQHLKQSKQKNETSPTGAAGSTTSVATTSQATSSSNNIGSPRRRHVGKKSSLNAYWVRLTQAFSNFIIAPVLAPHTLFDAIRTSIWYRLLTIKFRLLQEEDITNIDKGRAPVEGVNEVQPRVWLCLQTGAPLLYPAFQGSTLGVSKKAKREDDATTTKDEASKGTNESEAKKTKNQKKKNGKKTAAQAQQQQQRSKPEGLVIKEGPAEDFNEKVLQILDLTALGWKGRLIALGLWLVPFAPEIAALTVFFFAVYGSAMAYLFSFGRKYMGGFVVLAVVLHLPLVWLLWFPPTFAVYLLLCIVIAVHTRVYALLDTPRTLLWSLCGWPTLPAIHQQL